MKVAVDISPLKTGHSVRGIGTYTKSLVQEFKKGNWPVDFNFFENPSTPPPEVDIIHYPYFDLFFRTLPLKKSIGRVVTIHDVIPLVFPQHFPSGLKGYINLFFQKKALKNTNFVICDSQTSKIDIAEKLSYPKEKIKVIHLAPGKNFKKITDQKKLNVVKKKYKIPDEFVLYVGDVNWNKNILNLIEAIKISKVNLVAVGEALCDSEIIQTRELEKLIKSLNLEQKITRTGYVPEEDLVAIYNLAKLTVLPSFYEGFGLPVLESMACGTPVICSNNSSLSEIVKEEAFFIDPSNQSDIAQKIQDVLNLPIKEKQSLSQRLNDHAAKFTWHKVAQETVKVYQSLKL